VREILLVAGVAALVWLIRRELQRREHNAAILAIVHTFGAAQASVLHDPKQLLAWHPLAEATRRLFPAAFDALDTVTGGRFPFPKQAVERAHAKVTSDWLAWEKGHDEEYRIRAAAAEQELAIGGEGAAALARARLERIEHEKIERYQQRYEEYVRTAKALQALLE
jgi:hypothetical protein